MRFLPHPVHGFTSRAPQRVLVLQNQIKASEFYNPASGLPIPLMLEYTCIWDTGATGTVISQRVVNALNLQPSGRTTVHGVGQGDTAHEYETNTYFINLYLPNNVAMYGARVVEGSITGADVLIGMDVIGEGDFAITHHEGRTTWTFRVPSCNEIDFVKEIQEHNKIYGTRDPQAVMSQDERRKLRNKEKAQRRKLKNK